MIDDNIKNIADYSKKKLHQAKGYAVNEITKAVKKKILKNDDEGEGSGDQGIIESFTQKAFGAGVDLVSGVVKDEMEKVAREEIGKFVGDQLGADQ